MSSNKKDSNENDQAISWGKITSNLLVLSSRLTAASKDRKDPEPSLAKAAKAVSRV